MATERSIDLSPPLAWRLSRREGMSNWHRILEVARFAPSPHNTQPWKLRLVDNQRARLFIERARLLPDEDTTGCFILCAMGMFLEALHVVAANIGYRVSHRPVTFDYQRLFTGEAPLVEYAQLELHQQSQQSSPYSIELFLKRRTSRLPSLSRAIPSAALDALSRVAMEGDAGQTFHHTIDPDLIARILDKNIDAVFHDLNEPKYHDEVVSWFRYGARHANRANDGLASNVMNMSAAEFYLGAAFPKILRWPVARSLMRARYMATIGSARHIGFLSGPFFSPAAAEKTGRCLLRFWLEMTRQDIFMHPFGNLVTNASAHRWLTDEMGIENVWLVFRFGYTAPPPPSRRLPVEALILA